MWTSQSTPAQRMFMHVCGFCAKQSQSASRGSAGAGAELEPEPCYEKIQLGWRRLVIRKYSSGAGVGAMLTKTENSGVGAISFLQELRSPEFSNKRTILLQTSWEVWQQFINFLSVTHQRPGTAGLTNDQSVLPQDQNSRSEVSGILRNYVWKWMCFFTLLQYNWNWPSCDDFSEPNACVPNPCQNGAACHSILVNEYHCECTSGYYGDNCEISKYLRWHTKSIQQVTFCGIKSLKIYKNVIKMKRAMGFDKR